jgi:Tfp pilus assembly protein PilP
VLRKVAHLVTEAPRRRRAGGIVLASPLVGRFAGVAVGTAVVVAALAGTEATTIGAAQPEAPPAQAAAAPAPATPAPARAFIYDQAGRRDPFVSLDRSSDPKGSARERLNGLAGLAINEATVKGVVKSQGRLVAMVQAPDNKTYIVRPNDRLLDGAVRAVTPEAVVFVQQVSDPLSLVKQREVRKPLRPIEEGK